MPRTRSSIARAAPKPHKLPTDILTRVAAFTRDDELARRCCSTEDARAALVDALERCENKARTPRLDMDLGNAQIADAEAWVAVISKRMAQTNP